MAFSIVDCRFKAALQSQWSIENRQLEIGNYSSPISTRGFAEFNFEYSRSSSLVSSEITFGNVTCTSTNWWPFAPGLRNDGAPRSRKRNFCPDCVPGGMRNCDFPSTVGTSIFAPNAASGTVIGTVT